MQKDDLKREGPGGSINENKGQDKREGERETINDKVAK